MGIALNLDVAATQGFNRHRHSSTACASRLSVPVLQSGPTWRHLPSYVGAYNLRQAMAFAVEHPGQALQRYLRLKRKVERKLKQLQKQRAEQLSPSRLYLPGPWQPVELKDPVIMYKVIAAQDGKFTSVYDKAVQYMPQQWVYARSGSSTVNGWPPLWSCMYAYQDKQQARETVFPRGSQQQHGARVLVQVQVKGKGYQHPDGRVAVSALYVEELLDYLPKGPADRVICQL